MDGVVCRFGVQEEEGLEMRDERGGDVVGVVGEVDR